ncbi:MAG: hypothetical protein E7538_08100 [Ruminococcaceae bacterium]|nr:hypothetical protein [Oscillospiraceae bacterium]
MTDKELKKLSRLELLELLLDVNKENRKLKEHINKLKADNETAQSIEHLSVMTRQVENALVYANNLTRALDRNSDKSSPSNEPVKNTVSESDKASDVEIYRQMLSFFAQNDDKLSIFPSETENVVRARIRSILERRKSN